MDSEEETFAKIINAIPSMGETGATIDELSKITHLERHTLSKYLNRLRAEGRVSYKRIGRAKVWFVSKTPLQHILRLREEEQTYTEKIFSRILADIPEGVLVLDFDYNIMFINRYLLALYGDCVGQKYYQVIFGTDIGISKNLEAVNRSYTIDQLCSTILENLCDVIGYDMGDILIYNHENNTLCSAAQVGYPRMEEQKRRDTIDEWKRGIARAAIIGKPFSLLRGRRKGRGFLTIIMPLS